MEHFPLPNLSFYELIKAFLVIYIIDVVKSYGVGVWMPSFVGDKKKVDDNKVAACKVRLQTTPFQTDVSFHTLALKSSFIFK